MALGKKIKKLSKQWSTHKGLILFAGAACGFTQIAAAYEAVNYLLIGATGLIGISEIIADDEEDKVHESK